MFSYQCSQLSTSESIIKVFGNAKNFRKDTTSLVSVVVLDEVGLAEDSPNLPLKALHPLLEDGTAGADKCYTNEGEEPFNDEVHVLCDIFMPNLFDSHICLCTSHCVCCTDFVCTDY